MLVAGAFGEHTACFPDDIIQQVLPCFNFQAEDNINKYYIDTLELCQISSSAPDSRSHLLSTQGHPWSQLPGCVPEMACSCVGAYLLKASHVGKYLADLKTSLVTDVPRLRNATRDGGPMATAVAARERGDGLGGSRDVLEKVCWIQAGGFTSHDRGIEF